MNLYVAVGDFWFLFWKEDMTLVEWIYSGKCLQNYKKRFLMLKGFKGIYWNMIQKKIFFF